jgi:GNAT superfamily N-acetyltransferase
MKTFFKMNDPFARTLSFFKHHGLRATIQRFFNELQRLSFLGRMILFFCPLPVQQIGSTEMVLVERVRSGILQESDYERLVHAWNPLIRERQIADRFKLGSELWLAKLHGELAGFGWTIRGRTIEPHFFPLQGDDLHLFDFYVFPEFRGRGVNVALVLEILKKAGGDGIQRAHIECAVWNKSQRRSLSKTPFCRYAEATKLCILGRPIVLWQDCSSGCAWKRM